MDDKIKVTAQDVASQKQAMKQAGAAPAKAQPGIEARAQEAGTEAILPGSPSAGSGSTGIGCQ